jgi:hypothetical protein
MTPCNCRLWSSLKLSTADQLLGNAAGGGGALPVAEGPGDEHEQDREGQGDPEHLGDAGGLGWRRP